MKRRVIVYRNYLLPPFVLPLSSNQAYMKVFNNMRKVEIQAYSKMLMDSERKSLDQKKNKVNAVIYRQILVFRQQFLQKLRFAPWYYDQLYKYTIKESYKLDINTQTKINLFRNLKYSQRQKCYNKFMTEQKLFIQKNPSLMKKVVGIPVFLLKSHRQLAEKEGKNYEKLTLLKQEAYKHRFFNYFHKYQIQIQTIAAQNNLTTNDLLQCVNDQFKPQFQEQMQELFQI